ncbi:MAG: DUF817 domain-containing protein [Candidatus Saccharimonadales bacterium]
MTNPGKKWRFLQRVEQFPGGWLFAFTIKLGWAAIFGGLMLGAIIVTKYVELPLLARYDWLFLYAVSIQLVLVATKLEKPHEVVTILIFHLVGLGMELFKTAPGIGSWSYPEDAVFKLATVPLYSGFMYAAVGSFIARAWRVLALEFRPYPKRLYTILLAAAIYLNFFSHHYTYDIRWLLFGATLFLYGRTWTYYTAHTTERRMPFMVTALLSAFFVWLAENIGTFTKSWLYPNQATEWHLVSIHKLGAWLLLMLISFIMIDLLHALRTRRKT